MSQKESAFAMVLFKCYPTNEELRKAFEDCFKDNMFAYVGENLKIADSIHELMHNWLVPQGMLEDFITFVLKNQSENSYVVRFANDYGYTLSS
jgi:hypothetical protein